MNNKKQNILVVTQYFWPENMRINDLVQGFIEKGHQVTVLTGLPNYPEGAIFAEYKQDKKKFATYRGANIIRIPMLPRGKRKVTLLLNYLSFFISASTLGLFKLRRHQYDAIFVYAVSPITVAIPAILLGKLKAAPVFLWVLDLWPETLSAVGAVKNQLLLNSVGKVVSWIYNRADYILFQSKSFKSSILTYCTRPLKEERLIHYPSWCEDIIANTTDFGESSLLRRDERLFTVMFAGNIGESQDFPAILAAFELLKEHDSIRLIVVGDGLMFDWIGKEIKLRHLTNIVLLGRHPVSEMPGLFYCADALLVTLKKDDIFSKTIPGKLQAYLATGKPVLGMIDGEAAEVIQESGGGLVSASGDILALVKNVHALANLSSVERELIGKRGIHYYRQHYQSRQLFDRLEHLFQNATIRKEGL